MGIIYGIGVIIVGFSAIIGVLTIFSCIRYRHLPTKETCVIPLSMSILNTILLSFSTLFLGIYLGSNGWELLETPLTQIDWLSINLLLPLLGIAGGILNLFAVNDELRKLEDCNRELKFDNEILEKKCEELQSANKGIQ